MKTNVIMAPTTDVVVTFHAHIEKRKNGGVIYLPEDLIEKLCLNFLIKPRKLSDEGLLVIVHRPAHQWVLSKEKIK